jgi:hypothetical protein
VSVLPRKKGSVMLEHDGAKFDLSKDDGIAYLKTAKIKLENVDAIDGWMGAYNRPKIKWEGQWISLCRTDLQDDVATGSCATKTVEEWREYYLGHIHYGVRITPTSGGGVIIDKEGKETICPPSTHKRFSCIDAWSDG